MTIFVHYPKYLIIFMMSPPTIVIVTLVMVRSDFDDGEKAWVVRSRSRGAGIGVGGRLLIQCLRVQGWSL